MKYPLLAIVISGLSFNQLLLPSAVAMKQNLFENENNKQVKVVTKGILIDGMRTACEDGRLPKDLFNDNIHPYLLALALKDLIGFPYYEIVGALKDDLLEEVKKEFQMPGGLSNDFQKNENLANSIMTPGVFGVVKKSAYDASNNVSATWNREKERLEFTDEDGAVITIGGSDQFKNTPLGNYVYFYEDGEVREWISSFFDMDETVTERGKVREFCKKVKHLHVVFTAAQGGGEYDSGLLKTFPNVNDLILGRNCGPSPAAMLQVMKANLIESNRVILEENLIKMIRSGLEKTNLVIQANLIEKLIKEKKLNLQDDEVEKLINLIKNSIKEKKPNIQDDEIKKLILDAKKLIREKKLSVTSNRAMLKLIKEKKLIEDNRIQYELLDKLLSGPIKNLLNGPIKNLPNSDTDEENLIKESLKENLIKENLYRGFKFDKFCFKCDPQHLHYPDRQDKMSEGMQSQLYDLGNSYSCYSDPVQEVVEILEESSESICEVDLSGWRIAEKDVLKIIKALPSTSKEIKKESIEKNENEIGGKKIEITNEKIEKESIENRKKKKTLTIGGTGYSKNGDWTIGQYSENEALTLDAAAVFKGWELRIVYSLPFKLVTKQGVRVECKKWPSGEEGNIEK